MQCWLCVSNRSQKVASQAQNTRNEYFCEVASCATATVIFLQALAAWTDTSNTTSNKQSVMQHHYVAPGWVQRPGMWWGDSRLWCHMWQAVALWATQMCWAVPSWHLHHALPSNGGQGLCLWQDSQDSTMPWDPQVCSDSLQAWMQQKWKPIKIVSCHETLRYALTPDELKYRADFFNFL